MTQEVKLTIKQTDALHLKVQSATRSSAEASFHLCEVLHESFVSVVNTNKGWKFVWEYWGYKSWFDFVEIEVGLHETTANAYKKIWEIFGVELLGAWDFAEALPVTKMRILSVADLNKRNVKSWLSKAKRMSCCELQAEVYGTEVQHTLAVQVTKTELRAINRAFTHARSDYDNPNNVTRGELLLGIIKDWQKARAKEDPKLRLVG